MTANFKIFDLFLDDKYSRFECYYTAQLPHR